MHAATFQFLTYEFQLINSCIGDNANDNDDHSKSQIDSNMTILLT
jgi:hypothetical protein